MEADRNNMTLCLTGDVMTARGIDQVLPNSVDPILYEQYVDSARYYVQLAEDHSGELPKNISCDYIWGDLLEVVEKEKPDLRIINLETAVTTSDQHWREKSIHYRMHPQNTAVFTVAGIDVCVLANNHVLDWGRKGLRDTLRTLKKQGIHTAGAGKTLEQASAPAIVKAASGRLLVFSYGTLDSGIPQSWKATKNQAGVYLLNGLGSSEAKAVIDHIQSIRQKGDRVVFSIHWGGNWGYEIPNEQQKFAHALIDAGAADLIHGHSSHHPKGMEVYKERLILYGCGDLINDYEGIRGYAEFPNYSLLYLPRLDAKGQLYALKIVPFKLKRFRLHYTTEGELNEIREILNRVSRKFGCTFKKIGEYALELCEESPVCK